jgi:hypothetical protein
MQDAPPEILDLICAHLQARSLAALECVSKTCREASRRAALQLHVTPNTVHSATAWALAPSRAARVTKLSARRVPSALLLPLLERCANVQVVDVLYCRVLAPLPQTLGLRGLQRLRLSRLARHFGQGDVFSLGCLPDSLRHVELAFDESWRRVDLDDPKNIETLSLTAPSLLVTALGRVTDLSLTTPGRIWVDDTRPSTPSGVVTARIESYGSLHHYLATAVLGLFGPALRTLVLSMPQVGFVLSQDLAHLDPHTLALDADFLAIDALKNLRTLEVRANRVASVRIPRHVELYAEVDGAPMDRSFFD